jgi:tetratricopeptide (TPR) repeat protein
MTLQDQIGDRAGALRTYEDLAVRFEREFDAKPAAETSALAERIRRAERTVVVDDAPPVAPAPDLLPTSVAIPRTRRGTRRRRIALIGGIAAALVVAAAFGAYAAYIRMSESRDAPSLMSAGSLSARDRVVVADFANLVGDSLLVAGIADAFRVDLSQTPFVRVLSSRQVAGILQRMERRPDTTLSEPLAREVAEREGAKAIVTGSVMNVGGEYTVSVQLTSAAEGNVLAAVRETAADSSQLIAAVDRASKQLRYRIGESLRSLRAQPPLAQETTGSLAALRKYTEGRRLLFAGRRTEAIPFYRAAIALDTAFAGAHNGLSMVYDAIGEPGRAMDARLHAIANRDRLSFVDRTFLIATHAYGAQDYETAIDAYRRLNERYPDDIRVLNNLALIYQDTRQFAKAESLFRRAAAIDSTVANLYLGIVGTQQLQGKFRESRAMLDLTTRRFPGNPVLLNVEIQDAAAQQHWEEAERQAETAIAAVRNDTLALVDPYEALASIVMTQGRLREAERHWRTQLAISAASDSRGRHVFGVLQLARLELRHRKSTPRALALVDSALAATPLDSILPGDRPYDDLARFYAAAGRPARARELLAKAERIDSALVRTAVADHMWTRGVIALAEGRLSEAEAQLKQTVETLVCTMCALPDLARVYDAEKKVGAAVTVYERYLATPWFFRYETDASELGWAMKRLADYYAGRGELAKAEAMRGRLRQLWRRADPELQSVLAQGL